MVSPRMLHCLLAIALLAACDDEPLGSTGDNDAADDATNTDGDAAVDTGDDPATGDGSAGDIDDEGEGSPCERAQDCTGGRACDPADGQCTSELLCNTHAQCGVGGFCLEGYCAENAAGGPCDSEANCIDEELCATGECVFAGCDAVVFEAENVAPNVLIVLDRSNSMLEEIGPDNDSKWDIARNALSTLVTAYQGQVLFGLNLFPGFDQACELGEECGPGNINVDIAAASAEAIPEYLEDAGTCQFGTPIYEALTALLDYEGLQDGERANYILLVTDGAASCEEPVPAVEALIDEDPTVRTFVVGFGDAVDPDQLTAMAVAGGTATDDDPPYFQADDADSLNTAFATIAGTVISCDYVLSEEPPDPNQLFVYFDGEEVGRDETHATGWDYDAESQFLTFFGASCDALESRQVDELLVIYGCPLIKD